MAKSHLTPEDRFWQRVDRRGDDECWPWAGFIHPTGYGTLSNWPSEQRAHRISWIIHHGPLVSRADGGAYVCHTCDNRRCVNPAHLFLGDQKANMADMVAKGRSPNNRGTRNPNAKLSPSDIEMITLMLNFPTIQQKNIAAAFGVQSAAISKLKARVGW